MENLQELLSKKFGGGIKISTEARQFDLQQTGQNFFAQSTKKDVQFFVYGNDMGLQRFVFDKSTLQSLCWLIALSYSQGELGSDFPTNLICVIGARGSRERNEDGTSTGIIYSLQKTQIEEIYKDYEKITSDYNEEQVALREYWIEKDWNEAMGITKDPPPASDYIQYGD